jgi:hypothetical protein
MTQEQRQIRSDSDDLLDAVTALKETEQRKRKEVISSEPFHDLAEEVEERATEVWAVAAREKDDGEAAPRTGAATEDVDGND